MRIVALAFLACLTTVSALHAQTSAMRPTSRVIGWPIYTSDGFKIGEVTNIGTYEGQRSMIGEVGLSLGLGVRHVLIPRNLAITQHDRIVLTITKDRVSQVLGLDR
jgi:sporulation protein YlmC with PRC-barrel domain